jgi:adenylosuccinate lyase
VPQIVINVARGLVVYPKTIEAAVRAELPFMATEEILMAGVKAGGDRQALHELIRRHSQAAAEQVKLQGKPNDLLDRLKNEPPFRSVNLADAMDPARFVGRAPQQVDQFIARVVEPVRRRYGAALTQTVELKV